MNNLFLLVAGVSGALLRTSDTQSDVDLGNLLLAGAILKGISPSSSAV